VEVKGVRGSAAQRGFSLVEALVVCALGVTLAALTVVLFGRSVLVSSSEDALHGATDAQGVALARIRDAIANGAARIAWLDEAAMFPRRAHAAPEGAARGAGGGGAPGGFPAVHTGTIERVPTWTYGPPLLLGDRPIAPVTISETPVVHGQRGKTLTILRTDSRVRHLTLSQAHLTTSPDLRLVARAGEDAEQVAAMPEGTLLLATGKDLSGNVVSALILTTGTPEQLPITHNDRSGRPKFVYFRVPCNPNPTIEFPYGLRNPKRDVPADGVHLAAGASLVPLLAPVTYYVSGDGGLYSLEGAYRRGRGVDVPQGDLVASGVGELRASGVLSDGTVAETVDAANVALLRAVQVELSIATRAQAADRSVTINLQPLSHRLWDEPVTVHYAQAVLGEGGSGPPPGYCLVRQGDPSTYPPGFDPRDRETWRTVDWWEGVDPSDPSTWYWNCGRGAGGGR
jgi:hypothetical protein